MTTSTSTKASSNKPKRDWMKIVGIPLALVVFGLLISMNNLLECPSKVRLH